MPFFKNQLSLNVYYRVINGEKDHFPKIVLVHGYGSSLTMFAKQIPFLKKHFQIILFDAVGHGKSESSKEDLQENLIEQTVNDLQHLLNLLEIDSKFGFIGHSLFGSCVSLEYALSNPEKVSFLIILNGGTLKLDNTIRNIFWNLLPQFTRINFKKIAQTSIDTIIDRTLPFIHGAIEPEDIETSNSEKEILKEKIRAEILDMTELGLDPSPIICPCLIMGAELDNFAPFYMSKEMHDEIADSELHIVKMTGHFGLSQIFQEYNETIFNFLIKHKIIRNK
ncbi:alpha/beta fold hydrolase [Promethearchaeum syntrophicum]|uniref:Alpha/beta fold hydrolase n=1 Tax=Promethearchaeum syntrophicum TaxID=2594042 RepID=A0A5B9DBH4_9ARCH|nr:alpha/beta hydrolase [Candidatus Prometheoarchaeum syntrophicum]QEE16371.1 short chain dehydrogenase [Candidatus Prometheoarchaeum syntrophicum]